MRINYPNLRNMTHSSSFDFLTAFKGTSSYILDYSFYEYEGVLHYKIIADFFGGGEIITYESKVPFLYFFHFICSSLATKIQYGKFDTKKDFKIVSFKAQPVVGKLSCRFLMY